VLKSKNTFLLGGTVRDANSVFAPLSLSLGITTSSSSEQEVIEVQENPITANKRKVDLKVLIMIFYAFMVFVNVLENCSMVLCALAIASSISFSSATSVLMIFVNSAHFSADCSP